MKIAQCVNGFDTNFSMPIILGLSFRDYSDLTESIFSQGIKLCESYAQISYQRLRDAIDLHELELTDGKLDINLVVEPRGIESRMNAALKYCIK